MKSVKQMFVYGTLMSSQRNHHYFKDQVLKIETAQIQAKLIHLIKYNCPTIVLGEGISYGELITYNDPDDEIENAIIALEQEFDGLYYQQVPAKITVGQQELDTLVFSYTKTNEDEVILLDTKRWQEQSVN